MEGQPNQHRIDVFISHASEDKTSVARPLSDLLRQMGLRVWLDEAELRIGDSLRRSIDSGLARCRFGVVIVSPNFLSKEWPQKELDALVARENGSEKVILPVWHDMSRGELAKRSPLLADRLAGDTRHGLEQVAAEIVRAVKEEATSSAISVSVRVRDVSDLLVSLLDEIQERADSPEPHLSGISTGFRDIDVMCSGLQPGSLVTLAGMQLSGKTSFAVNVAQHVSVSEGLPVIFFSLTERPDSVLRRFICAMARIEPFDLSAARLPEEGWSALVEAVERMRNAPLKIVHSPTLSFSDLEAALKTEVANFGGAAGLVVIDSLEFLQDGSGKFVGAEALIGLRRTAAHLNVPILLLAHVDSTDRIDPRPVLSDLELGMRIVQISDSIMFLHRNRDVGHDMDTVEVIFAKQKGGFPTGTVLLGFQHRFGTFSQLVTRGAASTPA